MEDQDKAELCFPQLLNESCSKPKTSQSKARLMFILFLFIFSSLSVALNLLVIISVSHFRQLHTPTNLLMLSLAVSDFVFGLDLVLNIPQQTNCWVLGDIICSLHIYVVSSTLGASIGNMILISVDRYVAICDPLHYPTRVTVTRVKMCICMCWTCSVVYNGLLLMDFFTHPDRYRPCYGICFLAFDKITGMFDAVLSSLAPVTVIIIVYMRVCDGCVSGSCHALSCCSRHTSGTVMTKKSELKAARTLGIVVAVFLMCFCPNYCLNFLSFLNVPVNPFVKSLSTILMAISPCLNPVIYALFYPWFRKAVRLIFSLQILQPGSRETNML